MFDSADFAAHTRKAGDPPLVVTDRDLLDRVKQALQASPYLPLRTLLCYVHERVVILRGKVPTYYCKQLAQNLVSELPGVDEVNNQIVVVGPGERYAT
jgi:osmotically-inducible protein OsmY